MENIGDWFYVVILVIAGISSIFSSVRKKAQQTAQQTPPREIITTHDDDDIWKDVTKEIQYPEIKPIPVVQKQQPFQTTDKRRNYNINEYKEGVSAITKNESSTFFSAEDEEEKISVSFEDLPENTEGWRKALVYNEILNRKY